MKSPDRDAADEHKRASAVGKAGDAHCPKCGKLLEWVGSGPGYLNSEQWDAIKAGEYFTDCADAQCAGRRHLSNGNVYFGEIEPPKVKTRAELEAELATLRRRVAEMELERNERHELLQTAVAWYGNSYDGDPPEPSWLREARAMVGGAPSRAKPKCQCVDFEPSENPDRCPLHGNGGIRW